MPLSFGILCLLNLGNFRIMMVLKFNLRHIFINLHLLIEVVLLFIVFDYIQRFDNLLLKALYKIKCIIIIIIIQRAFRESFHSERDFIVRFTNHFIPTWDKNNSAEAGQGCIDHRGGNTPTPPQIAPCIYIIIENDFYHFYFLHFYQIWIRTEL